MDVTAFTQFVSNVGFPIACCAALFWQMNKSDARHKEEVDRLAAVIEGNTNVLTRICTKMEVNDHDD